MGPPEGGRVTSFNEVTGVLTFQPDAGFTGDAAFSYRVRDKDGWSAPAAVTLRFTATLPLMPIRALEPRGMGSAASLRNFAHLDPGASVSAPLPLEAGQTVSLRGLLVSSSVTVTLEEPNRMTLFSGPWSGEVPVDRIRCRQTGRHRLRFANGGNFGADVSFDLVCGAATADARVTSLATARVLPVEPAGARTQQAAVLSKVTAAPGTSGIIASDDFNTGASLGPAWSTWQSDPAGSVGIGTEGTARGLAMRSTGATPVTCEATLTVNPGAVSDLSLSYRHIIPTTTAGGFPVSGNRFTGHIDGEAISVSIDGNTWHVVNTFATVPPYNAIRTVSLNAGLLAARWVTGRPFHIRWQQMIVPDERFMLDDVVLRGAQNGSDWWQFSLTHPQTIELHAAPLNHFPVAISLTNAAGAIQSFTAGDGSIPCRIRHDLAAGTWFVRAQGRQGAAFHLALLTDTAQEIRRPAGNPVLEALGGSQSAFTGYLAAAPSGAVRAAFIADHGFSPQTTSNNALVAAMVRSWQPDIVVSGGDTNYGTTRSSWEANVGAFYGSFMKGRANGSFPGQTSAVQRFFPSVGNHDTYQQPGRSIRDYLDYYHHNPGGSPRLPLDSGAEHHEFSSFYRFQRGAAEFFMVDSEHATTDTAYRDRQRAWLNRHLPAGAARWRFPVIHHPPYSSGSVHGNQVHTQWNEWRAGDAVLSGDDHVYERLYMRDTLGLICGTGGASLYSFNTPVPESQFRYNTFHGALLITADSESARIEMRSLDDGASGAAGGLVVDAVQFGEPSETSSQPDIISFPIVAGQRITLRTLTPSMSTGAPNLLDPRLEIVSPDNTIAAADDNSAGDGRNAFLSWQAESNMDARVRISRGNANDGDYRVLVNAPFDAWLVEMIGTPAERTPGDDSDGDGVPHLLEYILGTDPDTADPAAVLPVPLQRSGAPAIEFEIADPPAADVVCELQTGTLVSPWQTTALLLPGAAWTGGVTAEIIPPQRGGKRYRLTLTAPLSSTAGSLFARLRVSLL